MGKPNALEGLSDDQLVVRALQGHQDAFHMLSRRHQPWVLRWMMGFCKDRSEAEDLSQEVLARVFRSMKSLEGGRGFVAWTRTIARNIGIDYCRKAAGGKQFEHWHQDARLDPPDVRYEPGRLLESESLAQEVRQAIDSLPPEQKDVVMKRYFENRKLEQIAEATGCPVGTVKSRLHAALRRIREFDESLSARRSG